MQRNKKTVLEKCKISAEIIKSLKREGLVVPKKIQPVKKPLRSPSEEWFYSIADRFTPPLTLAEKEVFINFPLLFSLQILDAANFFFEVSSILYEALEKVETELKKDEEKLAAILAILRIFHGSLDYNYLKYDRHLEYHQYKESPVGYHWQRLKKFCFKAAKRDKVKNPKDWVNRKVLEIISGPRRLLITNEYAIACKRLYKLIKKKVSDFDLKEIKTKHPNLFEIIRQYSKSFHRLPQEFLKDVFRARDINPYEEMMKKRRISIKVIEEIKSKLSPKEADEFERTVEIIEEFLSVQELEGLIAAGTKKNTEIGFFDALLEGYDRLKALLISNPKLVKPKYKKRMIEFLKAEDMFSKYVAARKLVTERGFLFIKQVENLYAKEIKRWL